mmetsp:Transcript_54140/g.107779  ORF Transcript_54140/g.107779 Transcript_54140/m.107779 type:complete len:211 (-) Transcript_54140:1348-1980(-)
MNVTFLEAMHMMDDTTFLPISVHVSLISSFFNSAGADSAGVAATSGADPGSTFSLEGVDASAALLPNLSARLRHFSSSSAKRTLSAASFDSSSRRRLARSSVSPAPLTSEKGLSFSNGFSSSVWATRLAPAPASAISSAALWSSPVSWTFAADPTATSGAASTWACGSSVASARSDVSGPFARSGTVTASASSTAGFSSGGAAPSFGGPK